MFQYINELPDIEDILNTLVFEDEPSIFDENSHDRINRIRSTFNGRICN